MSDDVSPVGAPVEEQQGAVSLEKPQARPERRVRVAVVVAAAVAGVVVGAGAVGIAWAASSSAGGGSGGGAAAVAAASFTFAGSLDLAGDHSPTGTDNTQCQGTSGYSDIAEGTSVTVYDASGTVVAEGSLEAGQYADTTNYSGDCMFAFSVPNVPGGAKFYQVEISHRGKLTVSAAEALAGDFSASLGK